MKRLILIIALLVPAVVYAQPSITFKDEFHDLGEVLQGADVEYTYEFSNSGTEDLEISKVATS